MRPAFMWIGWVRDRLRETGNETIRARRHERPGWFLRKDDWIRRASGVKNAGVSKARNEARS